MPMTDIGSLPFRSRWAQTAALLALVVLSSCDSEQHGANSARLKTPEAQIEGAVSDIHGPLVEGTLEARDADDRLLLNQPLDGRSNHYMLKIPAGTPYPVVLTVTPPEGSLSQRVRAVVTSPLADRMDITDITSLVVDAALALGGLTEENIAKASGGAIGLRQRQGVSAGAGGGGAGAGQSGGGVSRGGHGGHDPNGGTAPTPDRAGPE